MEGCNLRHALNEIKQLLMTPMKGFTGRRHDGDTTPTSPQGGDAESAVQEGDLPGQFTRILGKGTISSSITTVGCLEVTGRNIPQGLYEKRSGCGQNLGRQHCLILTS